MEIKKQILNDRYLQILLGLCLIYVIYWVAYGTYQYSTFSVEYWDIGTFLSSMYQHVSCLSAVPGLQYLVFSNHISPFLLIIVPFFAAFPSPITLYLIQDLFLAITAIVLYLVCRDLLEKRSIGFVLAFAFLINPGVRGLTIFDFHQEAFVPLFYILTFYFFWKMERRYFAISYFLLLSLFEPSVLIGIVLLVGLLFYELAYESRSEKERSRYKERMKLIAIGIAMTVIFALFYLGVSSYLISSYHTAAYSSVPPLQMVTPYLSQQINAILNPSIVSTSATTQLYINYYGSLGLAIIFLGFGFTSLVSPVTSIIFMSPWIGEVFLVKNASFAFPTLQYYGFFAGASAVASILGLLIIKEKRTKILRFIDYNSKRFQTFLIGYIISSTIILSIAILMGTSTSASLLLQNAPSLNYTQIGRVIAMIPANSSVLAQITVIPHLYQYCSIELPPTDTPAWFTPINRSVFWFKPDYIIFDKNLLEYQDLVDQNSVFNVFSYTRYNYTLEYNESGIYLYRLK